MCVRVDERDIAVSKQENAGPQGGRRNFPLVAGAPLSNYMQIEIEPFPLVA